MPAKAKTSVSIDEVKIDGVEPELVADEPAEDLETEATEAIEAADSIEQQKILLDHYYPLPEGFPSEEQISEWESEFGRVRIRRIMPLEAYVVRAMSRAEYKLMLNLLSSKVTDKTTAIDMRMLEEEMYVERCVLYPKITLADIQGTSKPIHKVGLAGTVSVLAFDIKEISNLENDSVGPFEEL